LRRADLLSISAFAAVSLLWFLPLIDHPGGVLFWRGGAFSDLLISHWPNAEYLRRSLTSWGQLPLWNATVLSGAPLAADPLAGLWYPPNWLAAILPPAVAYNVLIYAHLLLASIGTWRLARRLGASNHGAIIAGLAFGASPKLVGHAGLGHMGLIFAVSWTPWVLLSMLAATKAHTASTRKRIRFAMLAGCSTGLVFLADPRWYPPILLLSAAFVGWRIAHSQSQSGRFRKAQSDPAGSTETAGSTSDRIRPAARAALGRFSGSLLVGIFGSLGTAAVLALPLAELLDLSTRIQLTAVESSAFSLPISRLPEVFASDLATWPEWQLYPGIVILLLAVLGVARRGPGRWFWMSLAVIGLLVSLGDATPVHGLLRLVLPGFAQLRVPPRALFVTGFALSILAAFGFDRIDRRALRTVGLLLLVTIAGFGLASWLGSSVEQRLAQMVPWIFAAAFASIATLWAGAASGRPLIVGLVLILAVDLGVVNFSTLEARSKDSDPTAEIAGQLIAGQQRTFSPSYSIPQPGAAEHGLELADGINPIQLAGYREYMAQAASFDGATYSVTLPPFPATPRDDWGFEPDAQRLGLLGVSLIVSAYPLDSAELELLQVTEGQYFYANPQAMPRAWIESPDGIQPVEALSWSPNSIEIQTVHPGRLVLSELDYPGWVAKIDGEQVEIDPYRGILRSVELPQGPHEIEFRFKPATVLVGAIVTSLTLMALGTLWIRK
jgi:hypothetical protein